MASRNPAPGASRPAFDPAALAVAGVRGLNPYQPGKPVATLERELGITHAIKLASNENPLGPSPRAVTAAREALAEAHVYPDGNAFELKAALAAQHGVDAAQITLGNGSNEILELIARTWLAPGRAAVFSAHAFAVYPLVTQAVDAEARVAPALPADHPQQPFGHDLAAMRERVDGDVRVVFVANPNNPTGTWVDDRELQAFLDELPPTTLAVIDEAYAEYVEKSGYPDTTQWLDRYPNLIVTRTFSKIQGLAGLRLGYAVSSPAVAELLNRVRQPFNVNAVAQAAGLAALADAEHVQRSVQVNREGLQQLSHALRERGFRVIPSVGNFVTFDTDRDAGAVFEALQREGVITRPVENYGLPGHLRVTVSTREDNHRFLDALDRVLA